MTAIVSPTPSRASPSASLPLAHPARVLSPPIYPSSDVPRSAGFFGPPRLMSPIHISGSGHGKNNLSKSSGSCSTTKRRRAPTANFRATRRRHCPHSDCAIPYNPTAFDQLSWISQVESAPECVDIWDIADLSLLPGIDDPTHSSSGSGIGPVRRRRSFVRTSPADAVTHHSRSYTAFPLPTDDGRAVLDPRTPPPTFAFNPEATDFVNLMPAFPSCDTRYPTSSPSSSWSTPSLLSSSPI